MGPTLIQLLNQSAQPIALPRHVSDEQVRMLIEVLRVGEVLKAEVSQREVNGRQETELLLKAIKIPLDQKQVQQLDAALNQPLRLKVTSLDNQLQLQVINNPNITGQQQKQLENPSLIARSVDKQTDLLKVINQIQNHQGTRTNLESITPNTREPQTNTITSKREPSTNVTTNNTDSKVESKVQNKVDTAVLNRIKQPEASITKTSEQSSTNNIQSSNKETTLQPPRQTNDSQTNKKIPSDTITQVTTAPLSHKLDVNIITSRNSNAELDNHSTPSSTDTQNSITQQKTNTEPVSVQKAVEKTTELSTKQLNVISSNQNQVTGVKVTEQQTAIELSKPSSPEHQSKAIELTNNNILIAQSTFTTEKPYQETQIKMNIQVPDIAQFPILNQTVQQHTAKLIGNQASLGDSLQKLLNQLNNLNKWAAQNKRPLRSESAQHMNKAVQDTQQGIKDVLRYINSPKDIKTTHGVRKALNQSGVFLEQKQQQIKQQNEHGKGTTSLHRDTKANVQRLVSATLYHLGKLASTGTGTSNPQTQATPGQTGLYQSPEGKTQAGVKLPDTLMTMIKQRLHSYGQKAIPADLPKQLERILKTILQQSNSALGRSQLHQMANLRPDNLAPQWFFELPIQMQKEVENLQILIKQESKQEQNSEEKVWSLVIQFDMKALGKVRAILQWHNDKVSVQFLAQHSRTSEFIESELDYIRQVVKDKQMTLQELTVSQSELQDMAFQFSGEFSDER